MAGKNNGTGQPISFRCSFCRRRRRLGTGHSASGTSSRVELTGWCRAVKPGHGGCRNSRVSRQYACLDCGHEGWSKHIDLEHKAVRSGR